MKKNFQKIALALLLSTFGLSSLNAGWVIVDDTSDGAQLVCCKKQRVYKPRPKKVVRRDLTPCDAIPTAQTFPLEPGEKLAPAHVKRCISCDQKYGVIK